MSEQIFRKGQQGTGRGDGSSLLSAGTTTPCPLDGENRPTREEQEPDLSEGDANVLRTERGSVFTAGGIRPAPAPVEVVRGDGRSGSKHQQGRRRHDLSLVSSYATSGRSRNSDR